MNLLLLKASFYFAIKTGTNVTKKLQNKKNSVILNLNIPKIHKIKLKLTYFTLKNRTVSF